MHSETTIPMNVDSSDWKNRFPGAAAFEEIFDSDEEDTETGDILSFQSLREAFASIRTTESELVQTIPHITHSADHEPVTPERPDYDMEESIDLEDEGSLHSLPSEPASAVGIRLETIIEAMLFVGNRENRPLDAEQISDKLRNVTADDVHQAVGHLNEQYQTRHCPYTIIFDRGGYRMVLRTEFEAVRSNYYGKIRESRLSQQAIDTLAVVAYRQPITAEEIQNLRQQSSTSVLNQLVRRNLLSTSREMKDNKSVVRYSTTPRFLELCQIKSLADIPKTDELDYR